MKKKTTLEIIEFGDQPDDKFYCLVDLSVSPDGLDVSSLKLSDPRNFDQTLKDSGCLLMFTGNEMQELISRGDIDPDHKHESLLEIAEKEGVLKRS
jgi:hypothetical protein